MKKILHVVSGMNAGGMETMIMNYYRNIDKNKYQFDFLINDPNKCFFEEEIIKLGGKIYRVPYQRENIFKNHLGVRKVLSENNYDVIHMHQGITYYYPLKYAKKIGIKNRIIHNHGINRKFLKYLKIYNNFFARKRISSLGNNYISCSKDVLNHIFSDKIIEDRNYTILPNAIDINRFRYSEQKRKKIRKEFEIGDKTLFIHIGTFTIPKNHIFLIEVFEKYLKENSDSVLLLVGNGELKKEIIGLVKNKKIEENVIFAGIRNDVEDLLSASDIMLFPSLYEGLPLTLIEAQANGIDIISSNNVSLECKISDLIHFVSIDNSDKWIDEIKQRKKRKNRTKYNDDLKKSDFSIDKATKKLETLYDKF